MILSDKDIRHRLAGRGLEISPLDDPEHQIQPASVDLRLGGVDKDKHMCLETPGRLVLQDFWRLEPTEFCLATTLERVRIPADLVAQVNGKSSLGRLGLFIHVTAGFIDPGFEGQLTLELYNASSVPVVLTPNQKICQLVLQKLLSPAEHPYGHPSRKSRYQGQRGTTLSREEKK